MVGRAEDAPWQFELSRLAREIDDGNYGKALVVAKTFDAELRKAKGKLSPIRLRQEWLKYDQATAVAYLMMGSAERFSGNYARAASLLAKSFEAFVELRARLATVGGNTSGASPAAESNLKMEATKEEFLEYLLARLRALLSGAANDPLGQVDQALLMACDGLGAIAIDSALPLEKQSLRSLRAAEKYFRTAQEIRDRSNVGTSFTGTHANQQVTFLRNFGRLFLKYGELKLRFPELMPGEDADTLLDRAEDYFNEADAVFSNYEPVVKSFRVIVHERTLQAVREELIAKISETSPEVNRKEIRDLVDLILQWGRRLASGHADLQFNQAELELVRIAEAASDERIPCPECVERLDKVEQDLLEAADSLMLVSATGDHPLLVICYAELILLEALRARIEGRPPRDDFGEFFEKSEKIISDRNLAETTVECVYFEKAKSTWAEASR